MSIDNLDGYDLIYIMGYGRSGSTLIESEIVSSFNISAFGEVKYVAERGARKNELCSCGDNARNCVVWSAIISALEKEFELKKIEELTNKLESSKMFPVNLMMFKLGYLKDEVALYRKFNYRLYQLLSDYGLYIDSSKMPARAYFLFVDDIVTAGYVVKPKIIWVVRDSRGVAWSCGRIVKRNEAQSHEDEYMPVFGYYSAIIKWLINGLVSMFVYKAISNVELLKYEDFINQKNGKVKQNQEPVSEEERKPVHSISGNPRRFTGGIVKLKLDVEWMEKLPKFKRFVGWLIGMPLNIWLKYRI